MDMEPEFLIAAVRERPCLYDKMDPNYCNRNYVNMEWKIVAQEVGINAEDVRKRWTRLRDYFQRSHKKGKARKLWYLYDRMTFLIPFLADRPTSGNILLVEKEETDPVDSHSFAPSPLSGISSDTALSQDLEQHLIGEQQRPSRLAEIDPAIQGRKRKCHQQQGTPTASLVDMEMMRTMKDLVESVSKSTKAARARDEDEMYCLSLAPKMRELDSISKLECQIEINTVLVKHLKARQLNTCRSTNVND